MEAGLLVLKYMTLDASHSNSEDQMQPVGCFAGTSGPTTLAVGETVAWTAGGDYSKPIKQQR